MQPTEKRIAALEANAIDNRIKIVIVYPGETQADALKRLGLPPDVRGVVWGIPSDIDA